MGSDSDLPNMKKTQTILLQFGVECSIRISSAHRTPEITKEIITSAEKQGYSLIIAAAGLAAHLPGVCASYTTLPVIGVPMENGPLSGLDALYSIVQMPPGIPVGTMAIGAAGAANAAHYAVQILALRYPDLSQKITAYREKIKNDVMQKDSALRNNL